MRLLPLDLASTRDVTPPNCMHRIVCDDVGRHALYARAKSMSGGGVAINEMAYQHYLALNIPIGDKWVVMENPDSGFEWVGTVLDLPVKEVRSAKYGEIRVYDKHEMLAEVRPVPEELKRFFVSEKAEPVPFKGSAVMSWEPTTFPAINPKYNNNPQARTIDEITRDGHFKVSSENGVMTVLRRVSNGQPF